MAGLFISYRRDDSQGFAGRLAQDLDRLLGERWVFSDVEIPPGQDFSSVLHRAITASDALLVVIGRRWAADSDQGYPSRLFEPADWVRTEIESAFALGKPVIPVLVGGATMPVAAGLPPSLQGLTRLQAMSMSDRHWQADLNLLLKHLRARLPGLPSSAAGAHSAPRDQDVDATTPGEALKELVGLLRERMQFTPTPSPTPSRARPQVSGPAAAVLRWFGRRLRGGLALFTLLGVVYLGLRLFADAATLAQLDALEARIALGWQRLQQWLGMNARG